MKTRLFACALAGLAILAAGTLSASDRIGVYALIDKVVVEPNSEAPEWVQIWGTFAVAVREQPGGAQRFEYEPPRRGYLYFTVPREGSELARREWADLANVAGSGQVVAFGSRLMIQAGSLKVRVRSASEKPAGPDVYSTNVGVVKVRSDAGYYPVDGLRDLARR